MSRWRILGASVLVCLVAAPALAGAPPRPMVEVTADNTVISRSCRVVIPPGVIIQDTDGNGAIEIDGYAVLDFSLVRQPEAAPAK
jgi:hypothetical protein